MSAKASSLKVTKARLSLLIAIWVPLLAFAQTSGCTDPLATNYDPSATVNDGSCVYSAASVSPENSISLDSLVKETSGLVLWNDRLITHNDDHDTNLYRIDTLTGKVNHTYSLPGITNEDWEEIAQVPTYLYLGDFGNNVHGNRTDLKIYRIEKTSLEEGTPEIDSIQFSYANQNDFTSLSPNTTDFDCEAFIVTTDSIFLFTKQWTSHQSAVYRLPKTPGTYTAHYQATLSVDGLITGATALKTKNLVVLSGYSTTLQPFLFLLYDFKNHHFLGGNKRKITVNLPFHQTEGIATTNGTDYFLSNEYFNYQNMIEIPQQLHRLNLVGFLGGYLESLSVPVTDNNTQFTAFPNPTGGVLHITGKIKQTPGHYALFTPYGKLLKRGNLTPNTPVYLTHQPAGVYFLQLKTPRHYQVIKIIKE